MLNPFAPAAATRPESADPFATRRMSFTKELPEPPELRGRDFKITYSILNPGRKESYASFGVLETPAPVIFSIYGGIPPRGSQYLVFYPRELDSALRRDGFANEAFVYDDSAVLGRQILDGLHTNILYGALESVYRRDLGNEAALAFQDNYAQRGYSLTSERRRYIVDILARDMRLGDETDESAVFLTRVTLP